MMRLLLGLSFCVVATFGSWFISASLSNQSTAVKLETNLTTDKIGDLGLLPSPRLEIENTVHDFGMVDPGKTYSHVFTIENTGNATLTIAKGRKSCNCARLNIINRSIEPGETGRVELLWDARFSTDKFHEGFSIVTNDSNNKEVTLSAKGSFKVKCWSNIEKIQMGLIEVGSSFKGRTVIYSQIWPTLFIQSIESSMPNLRWEISEADGDERLKLDAITAKEINLAVSSIDKVGQFQHFVRITASEKEQSPESEWMTVDVFISGIVLGKYLITCDKFDYKNAIDFKSVRNDQSHEASFLVKVAAKDKRLPNPTFASFPEGIELDWKTVNSEKGLYQGKILVPAGLPQGDYQNEHNQAWVRLNFDHPEIESIKIPVVLRLYSPSKEVGY